jgi:hypothetical protein
VAGPALAVVRGGEEALDEALVGVGAGILFEGFDVLRGRRQAEEV